jgi:hypothetical protein
MEQRPEDLQTQLKTVLSARVEHLIANLDNAEIAEADVTTLLTYIRTASVIASRAMQIETTLSQEVPRNKATKLEQQRQDLMQHMSTTLAQLKTS